MSLKSEVDLIETEMATVKNTFSAFTREFEKYYFGVNMNSEDFTDKVFNQDALEAMSLLLDESIDLIVADPPYNLGKDYGNDSDKKESQEFLRWTEEWLNLAISKLKPNGSLYIFATWRYSPEIFVFLKSKMIMLNEIIWNRKVPSMGGSTRRYSSVHDTIGFFAKSKEHYFDLDSIRIPYDEETKKSTFTFDFCR